MYFIKTLERTISVHPSFLGPRIREILMQRLVADVEGTNTGSYFILCVMNVDYISMGRVMPGTGFAEYQLQYKAVVWRPFRGEALDGIVTNVLYNGFFADVGPMNVFVSKQMIPSDIVYEGNTNPPQFTDHQGQTIEKGTHCRLKVKGIRTEMGELFVLATIKEDYLGPLEG